MTNLPPCPHCGSDDEGFAIRGTMRGPSESYYDQDGKYLEMSTDNMYVTLSIVIRCAGCNKIRRDVRRVGETIVEMLRK